MLKKVSLLFVIAICACALCFGTEAYTEISKNTMKRAFAHGVIGSDTIEDGIIKLLNKIDILEDVCKTTKGGE